MWWLSIPPERDHSSGLRGEESQSIQSPAPERGDLWVRVLIPLAVGSLFIAVLLGETGSTRVDLQLIAPRSAAPGEAIPVRALLLDLRGSAPALVESPDPAVVVRLRDLEGLPIANHASELRAGGPFGVEGSLELPDVEGEVEIFAEARLGEDAAFVSRRIELTNERAALARRGRLQTDLQRYGLGDVEGPAPPSQMDVRIEGGDCSAPGRCVVWVWLGEPPATASLQNGEGLAGEPRCDEHDPTSGLVRCELEAANNEAMVDLVAERDGAEVGRRRIRLPMGLAAPRLRVRPRVVLNGAIEVELARRHDEPGEVLVDLFHEERWYATQTLAQGTHRIELPEHGSWRIQARTDPFGSDHAATRLVIASSSVEQAFRHLRSHPRQLEWEDPMAATEAPWAANGPDAAASFMLALGELAVAIPPGNTSGAAQINAGLHDVHKHRRAGAAFLIALAGLFVAIVVYRRGMVATRQARAILALEGEADASSTASSMGDDLDTPRTAWSVIGAAFFVIAVFGVVAILVVSRGCL